MPVNKSDATRARAVGVEGKRFLVLCAMNAQPYAVGGEVDSFWHTFVLFTVRYAKFCQAVAGHFIHHIPGDDMTDDAATARARYAATLRDYQLAFGQAPDPSIWPRSVAAGNDSDAGHAFTTARLRWMPRSPAFMIAPRGR